MVKFESLNELTLKITCDGQGEVFTKAGAFIGGESLAVRTISLKKYF